MSNASAVPPAGGAGAAAAPAVLCDMLGPSQHVGECSFDTIQYLFFNADGIKEITQPLFLRITDAEIERIVHETAYEEKEGILRDESLIVKGLIAIRDRYQTHLEFLKTPEVEACGGDPNAIKDLYKSITDTESFAYRYKYGSHIPANWTPHPKRQFSQKFSLAAAQALQNKRNFPSSNLDMYEAGNTEEHAIYFLNYLFKLFEIPYAAFFQHKQDIIELPFLTVGFHISTDTIQYTIDDKHDTPYWRKGSHAIGIVKCNTTWYLYDDNRGVFKMPDDKMLRFILNYIHNPSPDYILAIDTRAIEYILMKIRYIPEENTYEVMERWGQSRPDFIIPKSGPYHLDINDNMHYIFRSYILLKSSLFSDILDDNIKSLSNIFNSGISVDVQKRGGITPMFTAARSGRIASLKFLLEKGANIELPTTEGYTPLMAAANNNHLDAVKLLVEAGSTITEDVMSYAEDPDIKAYLESKKPVVPVAPLARRRSRKARKSRKGRKRSRKA